jgi:hypothetical protein
MLIPKTQKIDPGHPVEMRVKKSEEMRQSVASIQSLIAQYSAQTKLISNLELKIARELEFFYTGSNIYTEVVNKFSSVLKFREEMFKKEIVLLDKELGKVKGYDSSYEQMIPFIKKYFKSTSLLKHYEEKVPRLMEDSELKRKQEGKINESAAKRLMRNQKKLEDARIDTNVSTNHIIEISNKLNLERFEKVNPVVSKLIDLNINISDFSIKKLREASDYDFLLKKKETQEFNNRFFVDLSPQQPDLTSRSKYFPETDEGKSGLQYKQNIQNNYYVMNDRSKSPGPMQTNRPSSSQRFDQNTRNPQSSIQQVSLGDLPLDMRQTVIQAKDMDIPSKNEAIPMPYYK